jgi:MFS family permease
VTALTTQADRPDTRPSCPLSQRQLRIVFGGLMLGLLLAALDQTIVATALPTIVGDLGGLNHLSWVVTAYLLTSTAVTPLWGKLSDLYGRRGTFQAAIAVFLAGSMLSSLSQNMGELIAFRAVQGLGGGLALDVNGFTRDPYGGTRAGFSATTELNRGDFGISTNIPMDGGGVVIGDSLRPARAPGPGRASRSGGSPRPGPSR